MKNQLLQHALHALGHPISIGAAVILLLNALIWQRFWPSWWTGKIGDFAWLMIVPFCVAFLLVLCWPSIFVNARLTGKSAILMTGVGFGLVKSVPLLNALVVHWISYLGFTPKLLVDPSDLLALPALLVAWLVWNKTRFRSAPSVNRLGALVLAALALIADSAAPIPHGIVCLTEREAGLYAFSEVESYPYFQRGPNQSWDAIYSSTDGGTTWNRSAVTTQEEGNQEIECSQVSWPLNVGNVNTTQTQLSFVTDQGIYSSTDSGQTLHLEQKMSEISSALVDSVSGNLVVAAGGKLYVRTTQGEWVEVTLSSP